MGVRPGGLGVTIELLCRLTRTALHAFTSAARQHSTTRKSDHRFNCRSRCAASAMPRAGFASHSEQFPPAPILSSDQVMSPEVLHAQLGRVLGLESFPLTRRHSMRRVPSKSCGIRVTARASQLGSMRKHEETWGKSAEAGRRETGAILAVFALVCFCKCLKINDLAMAPQAELRYEHANGEIGVRGFLQGVNRQGIFRKCIRIRSIA